MSKQVAVTIKILDKEFQIGCAPSEKNALLASADYLNAQMKTVKDSGVIGADRIAILAALNITREHLQDKQRVNDYQALSDGLDSLSERIGETLAELDTSASSSN